jgi:hypothetical protein
LGWIRAPIIANRRQMLCYEIRTLNRLLAPVKKVKSLP